MKCKASIEPFSIYLFIRLLAAVRQVFINSSVMLWFKIIEIHYQETRERLYVLWCVMCKIIYRLHLLSKVDKTAFDSRQAPAPDHHWLHERPTSETPLPPSKRILCLSSTPFSFVSFHRYAMCVNRLNKLSPRIRVYNFARILTSFATCFITFVLISSLAIYRQTIQA